MFTGPIDVVKDIGVSGLFKGSGATVAREMVGLGSYFVTYEYLKRTLTPQGRDSPPALLMFVAGGLTGMVTWTVNLPFDVIKSRIQADKKRQLKWLEVAKSTYQQGGIRLFYKGWSAAMLRAFPVHSCTLLTYELTMKVLNYLGSSDWWRILNHTQMIGSWIFLNSFGNVLGNWMHLWSFLLFMVRTQL